MRPCKGWLLAGWSRVPAGSPAMGWGRPPLLTCLALMVLPAAASRGSAGHGMMTASGRKGTSW